MHVVILMNRQSDLPQIVETLRPPRCFTRRLDRGEQQRDQCADDGNDNQQFDKRKAATFHAKHRTCTAVVVTAATARQAPGATGVSPVPNEVSDFDSPIIVPTDYL